MKSTGAILLFLFPSLVFSQLLPKGFTGRSLLVLSDADFTGLTYATGELPRKAGELKDQLTVFDLKKNTILQANVSNAVPGPPFAGAASGNGQFFYACEWHGQAKTGDTKRSDLKAGRFVNAFEIGDSQITKTDSLELMNNPESVNLNADGTILVVTNTQIKDQEITLIKIKNGKFGDKATYGLADFGIAPDEQFTAKGLGVSYAEWHPSGQYLALCLYARNQVLFLKLKNSETLTLERIGNAVNVGSDPYSGRWLPNGLFFVTTDWGRDFSAKTLEERLPTKRGTVSVVQFSPNPTDIKLASQTETGRSPEGLAISLDGKYLATCNMQESALPQNAKRYSPFASICLLKIDSKTGKTKMLDEITFRGRLPEGITFDASGKYVAAAVFDYEDRPNEGGLEIVAIKNNKLKLIKTISAPRGAHQVILIP